MSRYELALAKPQRRHQRGAALVVGMLLLLVLTVLAISGMNTSTLELQMAGNAQYGQNAFQAAEIGLERAMHLDDYNTADETPLESAAGAADKFRAVMRFNEDNGVTDVPDSANSMGVGVGYKAYHFDVTSTGSSERGAQSTHVQSFYVKGQASE
jgi:type IV pilus assembly protein PilX